MVEIHSRACTVPCSKTAGFLPFPSLPKMWMPVMGRPSSELPDVTTSALAPWAAARSLRNLMWSSYGWYELNHSGPVVLAGAAAAAAARQPVFGHSP